MYRKLCKLLTRNSLTNLLFFVSLLSLRLEIAATLNLSLKSALAAGMGLGFVYDSLALVCVHYGAKLLWSLTNLSLKICWMSLAFVTFLTTLANTLYIRFFNVPLDWWIIKIHYQDLLAVKTSAAQLSNQPLILVSTLTFLCSLLSYLRAYQSPKEIANAAEMPLIVHRALSFIEATVILTLFVLLVGYLPFKLDKQYSDSILKDQILRRWLLQNFAKDLYAGVGTNWAKLFLEISKDETQEQNLQTALLNYQNLGLTLRPKQENPSSLPLGTVNAYPLYRLRQTDKQLAKQYQKLFGFKTGAPINVIVLFVESLRIFEILHPEIGPQIFPYLQERLKKQSIFFTSAYSSSLQAGETVRGQFSTLCSTLPNMLGAATYIAHPTLQIICLAEFLKARNYLTIWMNAYDSNFHQKRLFESLHGTDLFYDQAYYQDQGINKQIGDWGLADFEVLAENVHILTGLSNKGPKTQPFFSNILTTSSHFPEAVLPDVPLPPTLKTKIQSNEAYLGYLSTLRYTDIALENFFTELFKSEIGDNTLVVLLGDHSIKQDPPHLTLNAVQAQDILFRIPLAFLSKNLTAPQILDKPVHQIDVAPTIASILGVDGYMSWLGRDILTKEAPGSPWIYTDNLEYILYRDQHTACYRQNLGTTALFCIATPKGYDPLFSPTFSVVKEDPEKTAFFHQVITANLQAIVFNKLAPPRATVFPTVPAVTPKDTALNAN